MSPKIKNMLIRTASGAVYVALMVASTFLPLLMDTLMCLVALLGIYEYFKLTSGPTDRLSQYVLMTMTTVSFVAAVFTCGRWDVEILVMMSLLYVSFVASAELFRYRPCPIERIGSAIFPLLWIVFPLFALRSVTGFLFRVGFSELVLSFLLMVWGYDTFAYLGGTFFGKHKMFERVSPKKTWEGTLTGAVLTMLMAASFAWIPFFKGIFFWSSADVLKWMLLALVVVVFGTFGDLLESLFKRNAGVKDSGTLMPGHGGVLDRFDSILFATIPWIIIVYMLV